MDTFESLADPHRRDILMQLLEGEQTVNSLVEALPLSQPSVSKHLKVLRGANLVSQRAEGQRRWYGLNPVGLQGIDDWLSPFRANWSRRLDALGDHLDSQINTPTNPDSTNPREG